VSDSVSGLSQTDFGEACPISCNADENRLGTLRAFLHDTEERPPFLGEPAFRRGATGERGFARSRNTHRTETFNSVEGPSGRKRTHG
jgi:hypothetical protein